MRCPTCTERNSVAARKCEYCGERFKRKPAPNGLKLAIGGIALAATASLLASYMVPKLIDPEQSLARAAKRMALGPKNGDDAKEIKKEFAEAIKSYLKQIGSAKPAVITSALQKSLSSTAFEVHVVELPRGMKIVEIDALLQATDFLVMGNNSGVKVFDLPEFEVFDDARILNDSAGPILALLGHSGGPPPHRPVLRTYALLPDYVADETEKLVPPFMGEGYARFDKKGPDVKLELSLGSIAKGDNIALDTNTKDEVVHETLHWKDARYTQTTDIANSAAGIAFQVAQSMHHPEIAHCLNLNPSIVNFIKANPRKPTEQLIIASAAGKKSGTAYRIAAPDAQFIVALQKSGGQYVASDIRAAEKTEIAHLIPAGSVLPANSALRAAPVTASSSTISSTSTRTIAGAASKDDLNTATAAPPAATHQMSPQPAPAAGINVASGADRKIVVRGLTDEGTKLAADSVSGGASSSALASSPRETIAGLASTAKSMSEKLSDKHHSKPTTDAAASEPKKTRSTTTALVTGAYGATLRTGCSTTTKPLASLTKGESLEILSKEGDWYRVRHQGQEGFVFAALVGNNAPEPEAKPASSKKRDKHQRDSIVMSAESSSSEQRSSRKKHRRERESHRIAMAAPEAPVTSTKRHSEDRHKSTTAQGRSRNKVKMAAVEPMLVP